ncbi:hypothetical protein FACS189490_00820 [Clostridia bacterium]|nr:hypothetical protein FACS189490_00820 [Clostridia bacterium]
MELRLYHKGDKVFDYSPGVKEPQWWITGFDPELQKVDQEDLMVFGTIDFSDKPELWEGFSAEKENFAKQNPSVRIKYDETNKTAIFKWQ